MRCNGEPAVHFIIVVAVAETFRRTGLNNLDPVSDRKLGRGNKVLFYRVLMQQRLLKTCGILSCQLFVGASHFVGALI